MADKYTPGVKLAGILGPLGNFPIALAENIALADGTTLLDYIASHGGADQWVFGRGDPPADLELTGDQRYFDQDSGRVWALDDTPAPAPASLFTVRKPEKPDLRFLAPEPDRRFLV